MINRVSSLARILTEISVRRPWLTVALGLAEGRESRVERARASVAATCSMPVPSGPDSSQ
jgi:hypothetical protein